MISIDMDLRSIDAYRWCGVKLMSYLCGAGKLGEMKKKKETAKGFEIPYPFMQEGAVGTTGGRPVRRRNVCRRFRRARK